MTIKIDEAWQYVTCAETGRPIREGDRCAHDNETGQFFHIKSRAYAEALLAENSKFFGI
jgi:hypothetical protein